MASHANNVAAVNNKSVTFGLMKKMGFQSLCKSNIEVIEIVRV